MVLTGKKFVLAVALVENGPLTGTDPISGCCGKYTAKVRPTVQRDWSFNSPQVVFKLYSLRHRGANAVLILVE